MRPPCRPVAVMAVEPTGAVAALAGVPVGQVPPGTGGGLALGWIAAGPLGGQETGELPAWIERLLPVAFLHVDT